MKQTTIQLDLATGIAPPQRLSAQTRRLAERGLSGEFGQSLQNADSALRQQLPPDGISSEMRYALAVGLIAKSAPLRILPEERIVGAATYREAAHHVVPILGISSTSHLTPGFDRVLSLGHRGLRASVEARLARGGLDGKGLDLLKGMRSCLDSAQLWHGRYIEALERLGAESSGAQQAHYQRVLQNARNVPEQPPTTFYEAVQSLWFSFAFQRLCGNWPGIGRIDQMLGPYLVKDLRDGVIDLDEARELLAHFWIKGTEWIGRNGTATRGSGDAQHYQNIVLSGVDVDGHDVTNEVTYLVLDVAEELHISDFPVGVRLSERSPERLFRRIAEVQRAGGGIVSIYNEEVVIHGLMELGIPLREARCFANDGCWEVLIPGKTAFNYRPFDMLIPLHQALGLTPDQDAIPEYPLFEALYGAFHARLAQTIGKIHEDIDGDFTEALPATLISLFIEDCVEKGRGYYDRGARYTFVAPHAGGMADAANSLLALKRFVYDEQELSLGDFVGILRNDWEGHEALRQRIRKNLICYGNGDHDADAMMKRLFDDYTELVRQVRLRNGVFRPAGISTFGREIQWRSYREATAQGFRKGEILATNFSPTPGTAAADPLAVIRSYCSVDFTRLPNGGTLEIQLHPSSTNGDSGISAIVGMFKAFIRLGGFYLNVDVVDSAVLREAQKHPEKYPNLVVRIAGWCARFHTLDDQWQEMVIQRAETRR